LSDIHAYDEKQLFARMSEGDEASFTRLFHLYNPRIYGQLLKLTKDEHKARELVQETFIRLWTRRALLKGMEHPAAYLARIASSIFINQLESESARRRRETAYAAGPIESNSPTEQFLEAREVSGIIDRAVSALPEKRQEIFRLSREGGLTHEQIATRLGLSIQTVKNQVGTALKAIQAAISRETGLSIAAVAVLLSI
jgi:RNA polymerase sigma-70 factor (family 1)